MKYVLLALPFFILTGCSDTFRYPCQDPKNWDKEFCKKPFCSANGTCPEDLTHYEKKGSSQSNPFQQNNKNGDCK